MVSYQVVICKIICRKVGRVRFTRLRWVSESSRRFSRESSFDRSLSSAKALIAYRSSVSFLVGCNEWKNEFNQNSDVLFSFVRTNMLSLNRYLLVVIYGGEIISGLCKTCMQIQQPIFITVMIQKVLIEHQQWLIDGFVVSIVTVDPQIWNGCYYGCQTNCQNGFYQARILSDNVDKVPL